MRARVTVGLALAILVGTSSVVAGAARGGGGGGGERMVVPAPEGRGFFRSHCRYSHTAADDPILMRGMAGQSMVHDFFGNTTTSANSGAAGLLAAGTTSCAAPADTSAYWVPALYRNGRRIVPKAMTVYYRTAGRPAQTIQTLPQGLEMIAGNETATAAQPLSVASWNCGVKAGLPKSALPPARCPAGANLVLTLNFPDCWDGRTLDGSTQRNVTYAVRRRCPAGYPVAIPQLSLHVRYPIRRGSGLTLSMGPTANDMPQSIYTAHADVINAWAPSVLSSLVQQCDVGQQRCGTVGPENVPIGITAQERRGS
jgi:Domain of unknown function (DUF1996)